MWLTRTYGPIARVWVGPVLGVVLADPKYIEVSRFNTALQMERT